MGESTENPERDESCREWMTKVGTLTRAQYVHAGRRTRNYLGVEVAMKWLAYIQMD